MKMKNIKKIINVGLVAVPLLGEALHASGQYPMPLTEEDAQYWENVYNALPNFKIERVKGPVLNYWEIGLYDDIVDYYLLDLRRYYVLSGRDFLREFVKGTIDRAGGRVDINRYKRAVEFGLFGPESLRGFQMSILEIILGEVEFTEITNGRTVADLDLLFDGINLKDDIKTPIRDMILLGKGNIRRTDPKTYILLEKIISASFILKTVSDIVNGLAGKVTKEVSDWKKMGAQLAAFTEFVEAELRSALFDWNQMGGPLAKFIGFLEAKLQSVLFESAFGLN
jgi:hypothetical protein